MKKTSTKTRTKSRRGWKPQCPECGGSHFTIQPAVLPELEVEYLDNGDVLWRLSDHVTDDGDQLTCANCGEQTTWPECDYRRSRQ